MRIRAISGIVGLAVVLASGAAFAQQPGPGTVARLTNLEGSVLVSQGDALVPATNNMRVPVGTRVVTMAGGGVVIDYDVGCDIKLKENEGFTVRTGTCAALAKEVAALGPASGAIGGGAVGTAGAAGFSAAGLAAGVLIAGGAGYAIGDAFCRDNHSPN
jgi:hypothetical protein